MSNTQDQALLVIGQIAVTEAMWVVLRAQALPWTAKGHTSVLKETKDDPAKAIDMAADEAITRVLKSAIGTPDSPLAQGCLVVTEERALYPLAGPSGGANEDLLIFVDPVDFTAAAARGLDGSVLVSFYQMKTGFRVAVMADLYRRRLYWRRSGHRSEGMNVFFADDPTRILGSRNQTLDPPMGMAVDLETTGRKSLADSSINVFLGKPERLISACERAAALWKWRDNDGKGVKEIFSVGGSLGPARVGEGTFDASVEFAKGFRTWDFAPGAFIAAGAGAVVTDEEGQPIRFDAPIPQMSEWRDQKFMLNALDASRQKFIVAATSELAAEIANVLKGNAQRE